MPFRAGKTGYGRSVQTSIFKGATDDSEGILNSDGICQTRTEYQGGKAGGGGDNDDVIQSSLQVNLKQTTRWLPLVKARIRCRLVRWDTERDTTL